MTETLVPGDYPCIERHIEQRGNCICDLNDPDSGAPRSASGGRTCAWCTGSKGNSALCAWQYHTGAIHSASDHTNLYLAQRHEDFQTVVHRLEARAMSKSDQIEKYEFWGLVLFVGIPASGYRAWTRITDRSTSGCEDSAKHSGSCAWNLYGDSDLCGLFHMYF